MFKKSIIPSFRISLLVIALLLTIILALILLPKIGTEQASNENYKSEEDVKYPMDQDMEKELLDYIANNYLSPEDYVVSKFKDHDIVFVGEYHQIKHDVELISSLIPILYANGIYNLGMEFANTEDQGMIDSLINGEFYDESIAREIVFRRNVYWCFQEYVDIFKVAWQLNSSLPGNVRKFRVFGLNERADWSHIRTPEDRNSWWSWWKMRKVWARGGYDEVAPDEILNHFVSRGEKALIYSGMHHAFTKYRQPVYNIEKHKLVRLVKDRAGNIVYAAIGDKAFTICLHYPWISQYGYSAPEVCPVDGMIDSLMIRVDPTRRRVGFDTKGTPFGKLAANTSYYKYGYKDFTLADFCDGYIYQKPFSEYETVTWVDGMINDKNLDYFKKQLSIPELKVGEYADYDAKSFNAYFIRKLVKKKQFFESLNQ